MAIPLPPLLQILGLSFYLQGYAIAPGENALLLLSPNGLEWIVGNH